MEITLTKDQLAIVAERQTNLKSHEVGFNLEKTKLDSFILGIISSNGVTGAATWKIENGVLIITQENATE